MVPPLLLPRLEITGVGPIRDETSAPVTVVEFGDFQCPFCQRAEAVVRELLDGYKGKVRVMFLDFPLPTQHLYAEKAAEAALCALDQVIDAELATAPH